jgi:uncharacterized Ntn-hydrolase superfamily protein
MTWSIVTHDDDGSLAIIVASRAFAVGALCPYGRVGVGAISTQALVNPHFGPRALDLLQKGHAPDEVRDMLVQSDPGQAQRQFHLIDVHGKGAAHTGTQCIADCGHFLGDGFSVAGNMLANPEVIAVTAQAFLHHADAPLALRLILAMQAGQVVGGDKRGQQAAALLIYRDQEYALLDLRVDDHPTPLDELRRLYDVSFDRFQAFLSCLPSKERPQGILDRAQIDATVALFAQRHRREVQ